MAIKGLVRNDNRRKEVNQSRRISSAKGVYPPAEHIHKDLIQRIDDLENGNLPTTPIDGDYTPTNTDYVMEYEGNSDITISLLSAVLLPEKIYSFKNSGTGIMTVDPSGNEEIDDCLTQLLYQYDNLIIKSNGTNWIVI